MHDRITIEILLGDTLGATARGKQPLPDLYQAIVERAESFSLQSLPSAYIYIYMYISFLDSIKDQRERDHDRIGRIFVRFILDL